MIEETPAPRRRLGFRSKTKPRKKFELPIFILPNLFTTGNLFFGFFSCLKTIQSDYIISAYLIMGAMIFDMVDGRVARMTKSTSEFGMEYDSICDVVSFGLAPSLLVYFWSLQPYGRIGWLVSFLYLACGALRLARFNVMTTQGAVDKRNFRGLPIPMAAGTLASAILFHNEMGLEAYRSPLMLFITFAISYFMVSAIPFRSFKDWDFRSQHAFSKLVGTVVIFIGIASRHEMMLFIAILYYISMNLLVFFWRLIKPSSAPKAAPTNPVEKKL